MSGHRPARSEARERWDETADVVVVGYGYAGDVAAIEAHDASADVLLMEKIPDPFVSSYVPIHRAAGVRLFKGLEDNIASRWLRLALSAAAARLITGVEGKICGVVAQRDGRVLAIKARRAVVLACGGFEANPEM